MNYSLGAVSAISGRLRSFQWATVITALVTIFSFVVGNDPRGANAATQENIPAPESSLGFTVGADFELATYDESIAYFQLLDAASNKLSLADVGRTSEGRPWYVAFISSPSNLENLEHYRDIAQRLAHPEGLNDDEARSLAREGKPIVDISGGLHASEVAGAQHTIQLAYDLLTGDGDPEIAAILDKVIFCLLYTSPSPRDLSTSRMPSSA